MARFVSNPGSSRADCTPEKLEFGSSHSRIFAVVGHLFWEATEDWSISPF